MKLTHLPAATAEIKGSMTGKPREVVQARNAWVLEAARHGLNSREIAEILDTSAASLRHILARGTQSAAAANAARRFRADGIKIGTLSQLLSALPEPQRAALRKVCKSKSQSVVEAILSALTSCEVMAQ